MFGVIKDTMRKFAARILSFVSPEKVVDFEGYFAVGEDGQIIHVAEGQPNNKEDVVDYSEYLIMPGFVDSHTHIAQINALGKYEDNLLKWLENHIFKEEEKFADREYAEENTRKFFSEAIRNGTTTVFAYSSPHRTSADIAFKIASEMGVKGIIGQPLMDINSPESLRISTKDAEKDIVAVAKKWHGFEGRLYYAVTPRFAVSCSPELLTAAGKIARNLGLFIQTHISEQREEIREALKIHKYAKNYAEIYEKAGLLTERTILAHAIHLSDEEINTLKKYDVKIAHCPSSNFFLHSGTMNWKRLEIGGLRIMLGTDVAAGPTLSMFEVMKDAYYANKIPPSKLLYHATHNPYGNFGKVGKIAENYDADFIVVKINNRYGATQDILSELVFRCDDRNIVATYIRGRKVWERA